MKMRLFLVGLIILGISVSGLGQENRDFRITIKETALIISRTYEFTNDSIYTSKAEITGLDGSFISLNQRLDQKDRKLLETAVAKITLSELSESYVNKAAPDDDFEYEFIITVGETTKKFHIYHIRVQSVLDLVKQLNKVLPATNQIGYDEKYLSRT